MIADRLLKEPVCRQTESETLKIKTSGSQVADAAKMCSMKLNLGCSASCFLSSVLQVPHVANERGPEWER